jgi:DNA-binding transcriptional ArsR family regulator
LRYALLAAEHLSFRQAASALDVRQSAVSRRVRALEDRIGVSLFERHRAGVRLTEAGRGFLQQVRGALAELEYAIKSAGAAGRGAEGSVRIGISSAIGSGFLRQLVRGFATDHPNVAIDIQEGAPRSHIARVREHRMDVAFVAGEGPKHKCLQVPFLKASTRSFGVPGRHVGPFPQGSLLIRSRRQPAGAGPRTADNSHPMILPDSAVISCRPSHTAASNLTVVRRPTQTDRRTSFPFGPDIFMSVRLRPL